MTTTPAKSDALSAGVQKWWLLIALGVSMLLVIQLATIAWRSPVLFTIGLAMGVTLYKGSFGFTAAYRKAITNRDASGIAAQVVMLIVAMLLFAPFLSVGEAFGNPIGGAVAPVGISMALGAFIFGIGMQAGGGCASGTLYTAGGGQIYSLLVLVFFCLGGFWGSLDLQWWVTLPGIGAKSLGEEFGYPAAIAFQSLILVAAVVVLHMMGIRTRWGKIDIKPISIGNLVFGSWPLIFSGLMLAILNWLTLIVAGHPWSITWGFALWTAKALNQIGWDPMTSSFWSGGFQQRALSQSVLLDTTSIMNFGILLGALAAAALAGRIKFRTEFRMQKVAVAVGGGLAMGYGARLAYGCNIGAFFSGIASTSLHGWVWIIFAVPGNLLGYRIKQWINP